MSTSPQQTLDVAARARLAARIREGDQSSFELLYERYSPRMLAVARRVTNNEADAQECVQDGLYKAYANIGQYEGRSSMGTWLHRIVMNVSLMKLRSHGRRREDSLECLGNGCTPKSDPAELEHSLERGEKREAVKTAIYRLPPEYRDIIIARDIEQMSTAEAARFLDISPSLVKTRLHRARSALKRRLAALARDTQ